VGVRQAAGEFRVIGCDDRRAKRTFDQKNRHAQCLKPARAQEALAVVQKYGVLRRDQVDAVDDIVACSVGQAVQRLARAPKPVKEPCGTQTIA
jgi:hypothetical protein